MCTPLVDKEAELQANFGPKLRRALPLFPANFKFEHFIHIKIGHRDLSLDGLDPKKNSVSGRYDLLVLLEEKPVLLAEFKAPSTALTEEDVDQALSYARAHKPPVPLVLVTNGTDNILRQAYDIVDPNVKTRNGQS